MDRSLTSMNAEESYMQIALLKKYYRLARCLLKNKVCKNYLNLPPPDSDEYLVWINKLEMKKKKQMIEKIRYEKDIINEQTQILDFIKNYSPNEEAKLEGIKEIKESKEVIYKEDKKTLTPVSVLSKTITENTISEASNFSSDSYKLCLNLMKQDKKAETPILNSNLFNLNERKTESNQMNTMDNMIDTQTKEEQQLKRVLSLTKLSSAKINRKINNPSGAISHFFKKNILKKKSKKKINQSIFNTKTSIQIAEKKTKSSCYLPKTFMPKLPPIIWKQTSSNFRFLSKYTLKKNINEDLDSYIPQNRRSVLNKIESNNKSVVRNSVFSFVNEQADKIINLESIKKGQFHINIQLVLIEQLKIGEYACDCLCLLSSMKEKDLSSFFVK